MSEYNKRISHIAQSLKSADAALVSSDISVTYLTGFEHSEGYVLIGKDVSYFLVDFRYAEAAQKLVKHMEVVVFSVVFDTINELLSSMNAKSVAIEASAVTLSSYKSFCDKLNAQVVDSDELSKAISELRLIKSPEEIVRLRKAQQIAEAAYTELLNDIKVGITEKEIAVRLEYLMKMKGAERVAFDLITVTGKKTSLPHGVPGDVKVQHGDFITFDIGAVYDGYHSDMTRTIAIGSASEQQREIYNIVLDAHLKAMAYVKAGVTGFDVDKVARDVITDAGYGKYFGHSTGHGVGLEIHEAPYAGPRSTDILCENMTVTIEPGIYLPDRFGVRIEDTVLITKEGSESFASIPKELIIL
ncbi:MAG: aminopeptidase P family protein [Ruminococcus sp.]|nr:aminopeptidase P family protein [Ruminococcus sp.]